MDERGIWKENTGPLAGLRADHARKKIIEVLQAEGLLTEQKKMAHAVNIHERCKQPIEFHVIPQWFIKISEHKQALLDLADIITWKPAYMQARYVDWVENLGWDWCISRQRFYGVPFPVWHCECGHVVTAPSEALPIDPTESPYPGGSCPSCGGSNLHGETDVMDTWNISSLTPFLNQTSEPTVQLPMSLRPQAHDIIRTWAFYTIVKSYFATGGKPWDNIVISGHVTQGSGKLSKSTGGGKLTPESLLATYSADAIRYWTAKGAPGVDTAFSEEQLKNGGRLLTKLWNAFRFVREHLADVPTAPDSYDTVNAWLHKRMQSTIAQYEKQFASFDYAHALDTVEQFFWHDFCDNYLEIIKNRLFKPENYSDEQRNATYATLYSVGFQLLKLYAPFVPHVTETLYQLIYQVHEGAPSLHTGNTLESAVWAQSPQVTAPSEEDIQGAAAHMPALLKVIAEVRKLKSELQCSLKTPIRMLTLYNVDEATRSALVENDATLRGVTKADEIILSAESREKSEGKKLTCTDGKHCETNSGEYTAVTAEVAL
jgi:valyl-tRNA synthetase